ncbi:MAG: hypothetical protein ABW185_29230 [Sedimenticola sp.]
MTKINPEVLEQHVEKGRPFSPLNAGIIHDASVKQELFDADLNIVSSYYKNRNVVIGRRGSGKTAFLHSTYFTNPDDLIVEIDKAKCLGEIVLAINGIPIGGRYPEAVSELWESVISTIILGEAVKKYAELKLAKDFLGKIGASPESTPDHLAWLLLDTLRETQKGKTAGTIADFIRRLHSVSYTDAKNELLNHLKKSKLKAIVLIDSLESEGYILEDPDTASAIKGLLKWVGNVSEEASPIQVRFSVPGEYYFQFVELSSNPIKDFAKATKLRWSARELISLSAKRFLSYLYVYNNKKYLEWSEVDLREPSNALGLLEEFLPVETKLANGNVENCFLYMLRHTQLLPRQLFLILNKVFYEYSATTEVSEKSIHAAVIDAGHIITQEIFASYNHRHPKASEACSRALPHLPEIFKYGMLHKQFNQSGKALGYSDRFNYIKMLIDIGAIGKVVDNKGKYKIGQFQYNYDSHLSVSENDMLCVHPIFRVMFPYGPQENLSSIYPAGLNVGKSS